MFIEYHSFGDPGLNAVAYSSSEAEWVAASEAVKDVMFLLQSMKIKVKLPIIVYVDNVGAIFKTKNITTTGHSKHVDISDIPLAPST